MIQHGRVQAPKASFVAGLIFFCLLSGSALFAESPLIVDAKRAIKAKEDFQAAALLSDFLRSASNPTEALEARFLLGQIQARRHRIDDAFRNFGVIITSARGTEWAARSLEETAKLCEMRRNPMGAKRARNELLRDYPQSAVAAPLLWQQIADQFERADYAKATVLIETYLANPHAKNAVQARRMRETGLQALEGKTTEAESLRAKQLIEQAEALFERRLYAQALKAFEQVRKKTGSAEPDLFVSVRMAQCLALTGEERRAAGLLNRETTRRAEKIPGIALRLAQEMGELPKTRGLAHQFLQSALRRFPQEPDTGQALLQFAMMAAYRLKDHQGAIPFYQEFLRRYPDSPRVAFVHHHLASAFYFLEDIDAAQNHFKSALSANPGEELRSETEKFLNVLEQAREATAILAQLPTEEREYFTAKRFHTQRQFGKAKNILSRLRQNGHFRAHAEYPYALFLLADCFQNTGDDRRALSTLEEVIRSEKGKEIALRALVKAGEIHLARGDLAQAETIAVSLTAADKPFEESFGFLWKLAIIQIAEGQSQRSGAHLAFCQHPSAPIAIRLSAGQMLDRLSGADTREAGEGPAETLAAEVAIRIGEDLIESGQLEVAESLFLRLSRRRGIAQPDRITFLLGTALLKQEKPEEARQVFATVLGQYPQSPLAPLAAIRLAIIHTGWLEDSPSGSVFSRRPSTITRTPPIGPVLFSFWPLSIFGTASIADPSCSLPNSLKNTPAQRKSPMRESTLKT